MRILHCSDLHLLCPLGRVPLRDWLGKRLLGLANLQLRRRHHFENGRRKVDDLVLLCRQQEVDLVICTGDYTTLGTNAELAAAREAVAPLMAVAPLGFVNVPGNHDLYVPDTVREDRFENHFGDTLSSDLPELCADGPWPLVRLLGESVAVVAVNSARPNPQLWRSSGRIPRVQLDALTRTLADPRIRDRFVFVITHYAPRLRDGTPDRRHHGLVNAEELLRVLVGLERGALLHGHVHRRYALPHIRPGLFNAGSATYEGREGCWLFEVEAAGGVALPGSWRRTGWVLDPAGRVELGAAKRV